ncbi:hypothetical protein BJY04DRAFT_217873 [Aspergillus karnatakaensis]|uniref:uncharacterized protein n=1 Tax=Aspergillus karnatakaensis TaxID=1810916 RepID=UPI003CCCBA9C
MLKQLVTVLGLAACTLATNGTFRHPHAKPVFQVILNTQLPANVTTPSGGVAAVPNVGGTIKGAWEGEVVANVTGAIETLLPSEEGEYTHYENQIVFTNDEDERLFITLTGTITYANNALHGFGYATIQTAIEDLIWTNYAMFVVEWMADFFTGLGEAEIFHITTGGRVDGKPIPALEPPARG